MLLKVNKKNNISTHILSYSLNDADSMGTAAALLRGGSTWRHQSTPYQPHTHIYWWSSTVQYIYIIPYNMWTYIIWLSRLCFIFCISRETIATLVLSNFSLKLIPSSKLKIWGHCPKHACWILTKCCDEALPCCWVALEFPRYDGAGDSHIWHSDPFQVCR